MKLQLFLIGALLTNLGMTDSVYAHGPLPPGVKLNDTSNGTPIQITGNIIPAPICKINNDQTSPQVEFGDLHIELIDGVSYAARQVPVMVTCSNQPGGVIQFSMTGTATSFDTAALKTNVTDLGVKIYNGGEAVNINSWVNINYDEPLNLTAVPIKRSGATLVDGDFSVTGTLVMRLE